MKLHHAFSRCTSLIRRRLHALGQWRLPARWRQKMLVEMPTPYLFVQFSLTTFVWYMAYPKLVWATDEFSKYASNWPWASIIFMVLFLTALWLLWLVALVISLSHGRALGEKLFNPRKQPAQSSTVTRLKERQRALREARTKRKMRL